MYPLPSCLSFFFFNDTATTEIYTLSLHDALPISSARACSTPRRRGSCGASRGAMPPRTATSSAYSWTATTIGARSEEHTSELQSLAYLVCRLLLEKKKDNLVSSHRAGLSPAQAGR